MKRIYLLVLWIGCQFVYIFSSITGLIAILMGHGSSRPILVASDRLLNVLLGGDDTETVSSRAYRGSLKNIVHWCILCKILDFFEKNHCKKSEGI